MDAFHFLSNRQLNLESLFSTEVDIKANTDVTSTFLASGNVLEKQVKTCTFEHYLKEKIIIMRSLRWKDSPQDGLDDPESQLE